MIRAEDSHHDIVSTTPRQAALRPVFGTGRTSRRRRTFSIESSPYTVAPVSRAGRAPCRHVDAGTVSGRGAGAGRVDPPSGSVRRTNPDLDAIEVPATEQGGRTGDDSGSKKAQARAPDGGIDDQDECAAFDSGDSEAFRSGHVEVAFEGLFATPEFVRTPYQRSEGGRIVGNDGANRLPWSGAFGVGHELSVRTRIARGPARLRRSRESEKRRGRTDETCSK